MECTVFLDPSHGGRDEGIKSGDLVEKDITLNIVEEMKRILLKCGINVYSSRRSDEYISEEERIAAAAKVNADVIVSVECNSGGGDRGEIVYSNNKPGAFRIAKIMASQMIKVGQSSTKIFDRLDVDGRDYYRILRDTDADAVIVKCAYLDNVKNRELIESKEKQIFYADFLALGVILYLETLSIPHE